MNPCEINALITAITNHLYCTLSKEDFTCLNIFISELSKSMFATSLFRDLCDKRGGRCGHGVFTQYENPDKRKKENDTNLHL